MMIQVYNSEDELHCINPKMVLWIKENKNPRNKSKYPSKLKIGTQVFYSKMSISRLKNEIEK